MLVKGAPVTSRLYSDYLFFNIAQRKSPELFHDLVAEAIANMEYCMRFRSVRSCVYDKDLKWTQGVGNLSRKRECCNFYDIFLLTVPEVVKMTVTKISSKWHFRFGVYSVQILARDTP